MEVYALRNIIIELVHHGCKSKKVKNIPLSSIDYHSLPAEFHPFFEREVQPLDS
jgi:hypothetical protein